MPPITPPKDYSRLLALICVLLPVGVRPTLAQNITPAINNDTGTVINNQGQKYDIQGGTASGNGTNLFHSFQQFNLDAGQTANFISAPSIQNILGRVTGGNASIINGLITVTGGNSNLYLMNPAGVLFGPGARLDVPASFSVTAATGIGFGNNWFNAVGSNDYQNLVGSPNRYRFDVSQPGAIVNTGNLELSPGQDLTLTAGTVVNTGGLSTPGGNVTIAAVEGGDVVRISQPGHILNLEVSNFGGNPEQITPLSLPVLLSSGNFNSNATGLTVDENGIVVLTGPGATVTEGVAIASGNIDTSSTQQGGEVNILGSQVGILNANINADGVNGGGEVFIGGDFQGNNRLPASQQTVINNNSFISANALENGDGGRVIIWSDGTTIFNGNISATGGVISGDGGLVEVSGKEQLFVNGNINAGAANGETGTILFDPRNIMIDDIAENSENLETETPTDLFAEDENGDVTISATQLEELEGEITLQADSDITVNEDINTSESVEFNAGRSININADIDTSSGNGNISLFGNDNNANAANRSRGPANINQRENTTINAGSGNITLRLGSLGRLGEINVENLTTTGRVLINANGGKIGRVSPNSLITAGNATFRTSDAGSIGLSNAPLRLDVENLEAEVGTGGAFINGISDINIGGTNPNLRGILSEGEVDLSAVGDVTVSERIRARGNVSLAASGSINLNANINTRQGNGNVTLRANDEGLGVASSRGRASITQLEGTAINTGSGDIDIEFGSLGNSGDIGLANLTTTGTVRVSAGDGNILRVGENSSINAGSAAFETVGDGGIGRAEMPLRLDVGNLEALGGSGGAFFEALTGITVGGARDELTGIVTTGGGDVELSAGGRVVVSEGVSTTGGGDIDLSADGNMTVSQEISTTGGGDVGLSAGRNITVEADISTSVNSGDAGNITLESGGTLKITAATLTSTATEGVGGNVTLEAAGDIETGDIDSRGNTSSGSINIASSQGAIDTAGGNLNSGGINATDGSYSTTESVGGDVTLTAQKDIATNAIDSSARGSSGAISITSSEGSINTTVGDLISGTVFSPTTEVGGDVTLTAVGDIETAGITSRGSSSSGSINIASSAGGINTTGGTLSSGDYSTAAGGDVTLTAVGDIETVGIYSQGRTSGGAISITSSGGGINTYLLRSDASNGVLFGYSFDGAGGDITLTAVGDINIDAISSYGSISGGSITITSREGAIDVGGGNVFDITFGNYLNASSSEGTAGKVELQAENGIVTANIDTSGKEGGGNITLNSNVGDVFTEELDATSVNGNNGEISINANKGNIEVETINLTIEEGGPDNPFSESNSQENATADADAVNSQTGEVSLQANNDITINEAIETAEVSSLELIAGRNIDINADIDTSAGNGNIRLEANSQKANPEFRERGPGNVNMAPGTTINAGSGEIVITLGLGEELGNINLANLTTTGIITVDANGGDILRAGENSLITAGGAAFSTSGHGSIGTLETPLRLDVNNLEAAAGSGGAFFEVLSGITVGGVRDELTGITTEGGDVELRTGRMPVLRAVGDIIVTEDISTSVNSGNAGNITLDSGGAIDTTAATLRSTALPREPILVEPTLSSASGARRSGNIASLSLPGRATALPEEAGGDVTLRAVGDINTGGIGSSGRTSGGAISITSSGGAIDTTEGRLTSDGVFRTGGDVTLTAVGDINTGSIDSSGMASGGAISITSSEGAIDTTGESLTTSDDLTAAGGNVTLTAAGDINTGDIGSWGRTSGGAISITSSGGGINVEGDGRLTSRSYSYYSGGGVADRSESEGGDVTLTAVGDINAGSIDSSGRASGGAIAITSSEGAISTNALDTSSSEGRAGNVELQAENSIQIRAENSVGAIGIDARGSLRGGNIALTSNAGDIFTEGLDATSANGSNGEITINANRGSISVGTINLTIEEGGSDNPFNNNNSDDSQENVSADADTVNDQTGEVSLQAHNDITIDEAIKTAEVSSLELTAGRNININADIDTSAGNGNVRLEANSQSANPDLREAGAGNVNMAPGTTINAGSGEIVIRLGVGEIGEVGNINLANLTTTGIVTVNGNGGDILGVGENSLISAGRAAFLTSGSGTIGSQEMPLRIDAGNLEAAAGSGGAFFAVNGGITVGGVRDELTGIGTEGGDVELRAAGDITATEDISTAVNSGDAGDITLDSGGAINIRTATLGSRMAEGAGGDVTLSAVGDIETGAIFSSGKTSAGAIAITSSEGAIDTTGENINTNRGLYARSYSGAGGDVTLTAVGDIETSGISSYGRVSSGAINITSSRGRINTTRGLLSSGDYSTEVGGDVTLTAVGDIEIGDVFSYGSQSGGAINITSSGGSINTTVGNLRAGDDSTGVGGDVTLTAVGDIETGGISSFGRQSSGAINITTSGGRINTTVGVLSSGNDSTGVGGDVTLTAVGNIETGDIFSYGRQSGGDVSLTAVGDIETGDIFSYGRQSGGAIGITSNGGGINTTRGDLATSSSNGTAGNVTLTAEGNIVAGNIDAAGSQRSGNIAIASRLGDVDTSGGQLEINSDNGIDGNLEVVAFGGSVSVGDIDGSRNLTVAPGGEDDPFGNNEPGSSLTSDADEINSRRGEVTLQAHNDITINEPIESSEIRNLQIRAGRNIEVNADIDTSGGNGNITLKANDEGANPDYRLPGRGSVTMAPGTILDAGRGDIVVLLGNFGGDRANIGNITLSNLTTRGSVTASARGGNIFRASPNSLVTAGSVFFLTSGSGGIAAPRERLRVRVDNLAATAGSGGAFFQSPTQGLTIAGITTTGGGDVGVRANGDITVTAAISTSGRSASATTSWRSVSATSLPLNLPDRATLPLNLPGRGTAGASGDAGNITLQASGGGNIDTARVRLDANSSEGDGGAIALEGDGNITVGDITTSGFQGSYAQSNSGSLGPTRVAPAMLSSPSPKNRGGDIVINAGGDIDTTAGRIRGGDITFRGEGNITTGDLDSFNTGSGNGGNVILESRDGNIDTSGGPIDFRVKAELTTTGLGNIRTGDIYSRGGIGDRGGSIILNSGGSIDTTAGSLESSVGSAGNGGEIALTAQANINTGDIRTFVGTRSTDGATLDVGVVDADKGEAGNVTVTAGGNVDTTGGNIFSASVEGNTGDINITAEGDVRTGNLDLASGFRLNETRDPLTGETIIEIVEVEPVSGEAGDISITSTNGTIDTTAGILDSRSPDGSGNITLNAPGNITTGEINASALNQSQPTPGGDIQITSTQGNINATQPIETFSELGTAGNVTLDAAGTVNTQDILSNGNERGGNISISSNSENTINVRGTLETFSENGIAGDVSLSATGSVNARDITTFGNTQSGDITISSENNNVNTGAITTQTPGGDSGNIRINGENVATGNLRSIARDSAGGIRVQATDGSIRTEDIEVSSQGEAGPVELEATEDVETGDIEVTAGEGDAEINIEAGGDVSGGDQTAIAENGNASINIEAGDSINLRDQLARAEGGDASINNEAGNNINVGDQTVVAEGGDASINNEAGGNLTTGDQTAISFGGDASINNEAGNNITTGDQTALSEGGNALINNEAGGNLTTGDQTAVAPDGNNQVTNNAGGAIETGELIEGGSEITPFLNNNPVLTVENNIPLETIAPPATVLQPTPTETIAPTATVLQPTPTETIAPAATTLPPTPVETIAPTATVLPPTSTETIAPAATVLPPTSTETIAPAATVLPATPTETIAPAATVLPPTPTETIAPATTVLPATPAETIAPTATVINPTPVETIAQPEANNNTSPILANTTPTNLVNNNSNSGEIHQTTNQEQILQTLNLTNKNPVLTATASNELITYIEQNRIDEFSNYFGEELGTETLSAKNVREVLKDIEKQTGKRSAVFYINIYPEQLQLILFTPEGEPISKIVSLPEEQLMETVKEYRLSITNRRYINTNNYLESSQQLYQWLIAPIAAELEAAKIDNLLFSMDAGLRGLPIAALHDGEQFFIENYSFSLIPSLSLIDTRYLSVANSRVLAMGVSDFPAQQPLPAVPVELETITQDLWRGEVFLNEEFTRENLTNERENYPYPIIHLATHANFQSGDASNSYIELWNGDKLRLNQVRELGWHNPAVELLVLSACRTAVGDADAELGFAGLAIATGVKSAVASLWYVSDEGTLGLMMEFYSHLDDVTIKAEALREAQLGMLRGEVKIEDGQLRGSVARGAVSLPEELAVLENVNLSHPYYWSGFTTIGSPW